MTRAVKLATLLSVVVLIAAGCGTRPQTRRAWAVGLGSLGTGSAVAAQACAAQPSEVCTDTAVAASVAVLGTALAAGAMAYLADADETTPATPKPNGTH